MKVFTTETMYQRGIRSTCGIEKNLESLIGTATEEDDKKTSFGDVLDAGIQKINESQIEAERAMESMVTGDVDDISEVAAVVAEADMALRFAVQVRDKLLDAYNQLVRISM